ncbi:MAG: nucleotidyltransferase domain-containing protein [Desulfuromonas sp.]|nr:nucleotidyltransferase domain-containing protein [Desulfuromonas sp.]
MRLSEDEINTIKTVILQHDPAAVIYLFGSRIDDKKQGGDIDILILSANLNYKEKRKIRIKLHQLLGEQKIDIVIAADNSKPFVKIAMDNGTKL